MSGRHPQCKAGPFVSLTDIITWQYSRGNDNGSSTCRRSFPTWGYLGLMPRLRLTNFCYQCLFFACYPSAMEQAPAHACWDSWTICSFQNHHPIHPPFPMLKMHSRAKSLLLRWPADPKRNRRIRHGGRFRGTFQIILNARRQGCLSWVTRSHVLPAVKEFSDYQHWHAKVLPTSRNR